MKKLSLLLSIICGMGLLTGCGGSSQPATPMPTQLSVTAPATDVAGTPINLVVSALDSSNNVLTTYSGPIHFTSTDSKAILPANSTLTSGTGGFTVTLMSLGAQTITAVTGAQGSGGLTGTSATITVSATGATHFSVIPATSTPTAGAPFNFTVSAMDVSNNILPSYSGTVVFTSSDTQAALPANSTLKNGVATFSATLKTAGSQTITAIDSITLSITGTSSSINVSTGATDHLSISTPATTSKGAALNMVVSAMDAVNNVTANYSGTVHFTSTDPQAVLPANMPVTNGMANFSATLNTLGAQTISATDTATASITGTSNSIMVNTPPPPVISATPVPAAGALGLAYFYAFTIASGGQAPFQWTETGALPPGLTFDTTAGALSGTPTATGLFPITLQVRDSLLIDSAPQNFTILVSTHGFSLTGSMGTARSDHTATLLTDGMVLVTGGLGSTTQYLASAEVFDPATGTFAPAKGAMGTARAEQTATLLKDGIVLIIGGMNGSGTLATAELFDPASAVFTPTKGSMNTPRAYHTATRLTDGRVLVTGGSDGTSELATAELFDPSTGTFTLTMGSMETVRVNHTATLLNSGGVLVTGGLVPAGNPNDRVTVAAELFDPSTGVFTPTGNMTQPRAYQTASLLKDGTVLVSGGQNVTANNPFNHQQVTINYLLTAESFDSNAGIFTQTSGNMSFERVYHTATLLNDGIVLVSGGYDGKTVLTAADIYDPANRSFTRTANMTVTRIHHTATLLKDGTVLVTGGIAGRGAFVSSAEMYK